MKEEASVLDVVGVVNTQIVNTSHLMEISPSVKYMMTDRNDADCSHKPHPF